MLTDEDAWALLAQYGDSLRTARWADATQVIQPSDWPCEPHDCVQLVVDVDHAISRRTHEGAGFWRGVGARLRLALGVAQAVSCCRNFDPTTNASFWRRVVATLWPRTLKERPVDRLALSRTTFAHVGLDWYASSLAMDAFWLGFLHGTPVCAAAMASVLQTLQHDLAFDSVDSDDSDNSGSIAPLQVVLLRCGTSRTSGRPWDDGAPSCAWTARERTVDPEVVKTMLRVAVVERRRMHWSPASSMQLALAVAYRVDDNAYATRETLDLLACARAAASNPTTPTTTTEASVQFTIDRLEIQLAPPAPPRSAGSGTRFRRALVARGRALGELLSAVLVVSRSSPATMPRRVPPLGVRSVVVYGSSSSDFRLVGAVLSAVALASPPVEALRCSGLMDTTQPHEQLLRLAWLAFTLHCRSLRRPASVPLVLALLSMGVPLTEQERAYMQQLVARGTPLRDVVGEALRLRLGGDDDAVAQLTVECLPLGTTVRLARGTRLYFEPMRTADDDVAVVFPYDDDDDEAVVDLVAHVVTHDDDIDDDSDAWVAVVYAGYGLVWTDASAAVALTPSSRTHRDDHAALWSLTVHDRDGVHWPVWQVPVRRVGALLPWLVCATLCQLTIGRAVVPRADLVQLLGGLPGLRCLMLDRCAVESLAPLVPTDSDGRCHVRVPELSLVGVVDLRLRDVAVQQGALSSEQILLPRATVATDASTMLSTFAWLMPLLDALTIGSLCPGDLRSLSVDLRHLPTADQLVVLTHIAQAVAWASSSSLVSSRQSLTRVHVTCHPHLHGTCATLLAPWRDAVLLDPPRVLCRAERTARGRLLCASGGTRSVGAGTGR